MNWLLDILLHPSHHHVLFPIFAILAILIYAFIGQAYAYLALVKKWKKTEIPELLCCLMDDGTLSLVGTFWPIFLIGAIIILIVAAALWAIIWVLKLIFCGELFRLITGKMLTPSGK